MRPVSILPGGYIPRIRTWRRISTVLLFLALPVIGHADSQIAAPAQPATSDSAPVVLPPTQSVPTGVRPLRGPPVVLSVGPFEIDAADQPSAQAVLSLAQHLRKIISGDLLWPTFPDGAITIQLIPTDLANFTEQYVTSMDREGQHTVRIRWGPDTALSDVCLALSRVTLESIAGAHDQSAVGKMPEWLKLAYGKMLEAETKPAIVDEFSSQTRAQPLLSLRQIMTAQNPTAADLPLLELNAYWLASFLEDRCVTTASTQQLFGALALGADPAPALDAAFPGHFADARDLELWWEVGCRDITNERHSPVYSMVQSRALLDRLEFVDIPRGNTGTQRTRLNDAWRARADKSLREHLATVMLEAGPLPYRINPVYKNALLSLLRVVKLLSDNDEKAFHAAWLQYQSDRLEAEEDEAGVEKAMSS